MDRFLFLFFAEDRHLLPPNSVNLVLTDWRDLQERDYTDFVKELGKKKAKLSLSEEAEWEDYFLQESGKAMSIKNQIDATDRKIDQMVYQLYGLTEEEIVIVEGAPADADMPAVALQ